jgi:hypothetical protein
VRAKTMTKDQAQAVLVQRYAFLEKLKKVKRIPNPRIIWDDLDYVTADPTEMLALYDLAAKAGP